MTSSFVSKESAALFAMVYRPGVARFHQLDTAPARRSFEKLQGAFGFEREAVAYTQEIVIERPDRSGLLARLYRPLSSQQDAQLPLLVYFHGGGWCIGDVATYDAVCRKIANETGFEVLSVDYRLAPEHRFPAAFEDALTAIKWGAAQAVGKRTRWLAIEVGGDSAGGTLALGAALALRDFDGVKLRRVIAVYPCVQMYSNRPSRKCFSQGYMLDEESLDWFFSRYMGSSDPSDWRASPIFADSVAGLPPVLMITAGLDPLTDDCRAFVERIKAEGGEVSEAHFAGVPHGFFSLGKFFPEATEAVRLFRFEKRA